MALGLKIQVLLSLLASVLRNSYLDRAAIFWFSNHDYVSLKLRVARSRITKYNLVACKITFFLPLHFIYLFIYLFIYWLITEHPALLMCSGKKKKSYRYRYIIIIRKTVLCTFIALSLAPSHISLLQLHMVAGAAMAFEFEAVHL